MIRLHTRKPLKAPPCNVRDFFVNPNAGVTFDSDVAKIGMKLRFPDKFVRSPFSGPSVLSTHAKYKSWKHNQELIEGAEHYRLASRRACRLLQPLQVSENLDVQFDSLTLADYYCNKQYTKKTNDKTLPFLPNSVPLKNGNYKVISSTQVPDLTFTSALTTPSRSLLANPNFIKKEGW